MLRLLAAATLAMTTLATPVTAQRLGGDLDNLEPKIWVDPNGCQHWMMDDGVEGYLTPRLNRDGTPVCPEVTQSTWPAAQNNAPRYDVEATLWTDRLGCQHWVADLGGQGFLSARLSRDGKPVCPGK